MKHIQLKFHEYPIFEQIKNGTKTVETRALNPDEPERYFGDLAVGDILECLAVDTGEVLNKKIIRVAIYYDFEDYLQTEDLTKIFGLETSIDAAREKHYSFPGYKERLDKYGIIAFELE